MPCNQTIVCQHAATRKFVPHAPGHVPEWNIGHWQVQDIEPYAVSTLVRDYLADGWKEITGTELERMFPRGITGVDQLPVHRAFFKSYATTTLPNGPSYVHTLTDKRRMTERSN